MRQVYRIPEYLPGQNSVSRHACSVLDEMRECYKTMNFGAMAGLIEEMQTIANRMEAGLDDKVNYHAVAKILRKKLESMRKQEGGNHDEEPSLPRMY